jgi:hypothetical protein
MIVVGDVHLQYRRRARESLHRSLGKSQRSTEVGDHYLSALQLGNPSRGKGN